MLLFADDIVLMAAGRAALQLLLSILREFLCEYGLTLSTTKTKWMELYNGAPYFATQGVREGATVHYDGTRIEQVDLFKYLGLHFNHEGSASLMCTKRIEAGHKSQLGLVKLLQKRGWRDK